MDGEWKKPLNVHMRILTQVQMPSLSIVSPGHLDEIYEFVDKWNNQAPLVVVPTKYYDVTAEELQEKRISMVIYANHGIRASIRAMSEVFSSVYNSGALLMWKIGLQP
jgi:2-methylisocitrate lyase-like PEP mutase family enzyme